MTIIDGKKTAAEIRAQLRGKTAAFEEKYGQKVGLAVVLIGFINGAVTDQRTITDDMFEDAGLHNPDGAYQSIFGLDVVEEFRHQGIASRLMEEMIRRAREQGRRGLILTCKDRLIGYYQKFGYVNLGVSASVHGGAVWYDMILEFPS